MPQTTPSRFRNVRVNLTKAHDAADVCITVERALKANGATKDELMALRHQFINADDPVDVAREWVDVC